MFFAFTQTRGDHCRPPDPRLASPGVLCSRCRYLLSFLLALPGTRRSRLSKFAFPLEGVVGILDELFLPLIELGQLDLVLVTQVGKRHRVDQVRRQSRSERPPSLRE